MDPRGEVVNGGRSEQREQRGSGDPVGDRGTTAQRKRSRSNAREGDETMSWVQQCGAVAWVRRALPQSSEKKDGSEPGTFLWWPSVVYTSWREAADSGLMPPFDEEGEAKKARLSTSDEMVRIESCRRPVAVKHLSRNMVPEKVTIRRPRKDEKNRTNASTKVVVHYLGLCPPHGVEVPSWAAVALTAGSSPSSFRRYRRNFGQIMKLHHAKVARRTDQHWSDMLRAVDEASLLLEDDALSSKTFLRSMARRPEEHTCAAPPRSKLDMNSAHQSDEEEPKQATPEFFDELSAPSTAPQHQTQTQTSTQVTTPLSSSQMKDGAQKPQMPIPSPAKSVSSPQSPSGATCQNQEIKGINSKANQQVTFDAAPSATASKADECNNHKEGMQPNASSAQKENSTRPSGPMESPVATLASKSATSPLEKRSTGLDTATLINGQNQSEQIHDENDKKNEIVLINGQNQSEQIHHENDKKDEIMDDDEEEPTQLLDPVEEATQLLAPNDEENGDDPGTQNQTPTVILATPQSCASSITRCSRPLTDGPGAAPLRSQHSPAATSASSSASQIERGDPPAPSALPSSHTEKDAAKASCSTELAGDGGKAPRNLKTTNATSGTATSNVTKEEASKPTMNNTTSPLQPNAEGARKTLAATSETPSPRVVRPAPSFNSGGGVAAGSSKGGESLIDGDVQIPCTDETASVHGVATQQAAATLLMFYEPTTDGEVQTDGPDASGEKPKQAHARDNQEVPDTEKGDDGSCASDTTVSIVDMCICDSETTAKQSEQDCVAQTGEKSEKCVVETGKTETKTPGKADNADKEAPAETTEQQLLTQ